MVQVLVPGPGPNFAHVWVKGFTQEHHSGGNKGGKVLLFHFFHSPHPDLSCLIKLATFITSLPI